MKDVLDLDMQRLYSEVEQVIQKLDKREGAVAAMLREVPNPRQGIELRRYWSIEDNSIGDLCPVDSMYHFAASMTGKDQNAPLPVIVVKSSASGPDLFQIAKAITEGKLVAGLEGVISDNFPLFREVLAIEDRPGDPYMIEVLGPIDHEDFLNYYLAIGKSNLQRIILFREDNSAVVNVPVKVDNPLRKLYWEVFLGIAKSFKGADSTKDWRVAMSKYQMANAVSMPRRAIKLNLVEEPS